MIQVSSKNRAIFPFCEVNRNQTMDVVLQEVNIEKCVQMGLLRPCAKPDAAPLASAAAEEAYERCKRVLDVIGALFGLIVLLLPMSVIALLILAGDGAPVLFRHERLGKDGVPFILYKFRTMRPDAEKDGPQWAERDDPRATAIGRRLRASHLDELPQLINVLRGEMSLVGPRPERACFYRLFDETIEGFHNRLCVQPGLTGWAQVHGSMLLPQEKIVYDMEYINRRCLRMDILCLAMTVKTLLCGNET